MILPEIASQGGVTTQWIGYVAAADIDAAAARAVELGGTVRVPPTDVPGDQPLLDYRRPAKRDAGSDQRQANRRPALRPRPRARKGVLAGTALGRLERDVRLLPDAAWLGKGGSSGRIRGPLPALFGGHRAHWRDACQARGAELAGLGLLFRGCGPERRARNEWRPAAVMSSTGRLRFRAAARSPIAPIRMARCSA